MKRAACILEMKNFHNFDGTITTKERLIADKILVLRELEIIKGNKEADWIKRIFESRETEVQIENLLREMTTGRMSAKQFIDRYWLE